MAKVSRTRKALKARKARREAAANPQATAATAALSPPYGYREEEGQQVADDGEAEIIGQIRELAAKNITAKAIAEKFARDEVTCRGNAWSAAHITKILRRRVNKVEGRSGVGPKS